MEWGHLHPVKDLVACRGSSATEEADEGKTDNGADHLRGAAPWRFIASFLPWVSIDLGRFGDTSFNAWDGDVLYWPAFWWVGIFGLVMAVQVVLAAFTSMNLPDRILGFTWPQIHLVPGIFAVILTVSFLGGEEHGDQVLDLLLASIGLVVGA